MKNKILVFYLLLVAAGTGTALAHSGIPLPQGDQSFKLEKLTDNTYVLYGRGGNIGFVVTNDGVLMVDDQFQDIAQGIIERIKSVTDKPIRFVVNTHYHGDHTGGNPVFINFSLIIAHHNVRVNMKQLNVLMPKIYESFKRGVERQLQQVAGKDPKREGELKTQIANLEREIEEARRINVQEVAAPNLTYQRELRLYLGGEEVHVMHFARGHTNGDSVVYFPQQKVVHMGDLFVSKMHPFIDVAGGGNTREWIETLDAVLKSIDPAAKVIPGHGQVSTVSELRRFRQYFVDVREAVAKAIKAGKSKEQAMAEIKLPQYDDYAAGFRTLASTIEVVYDEMQADGR